MQISPEIVTAFGGAIVALLGSYGKKVHTSRKYQNGHDRRERPISNSDEEFKAFVRRELMHIRERVIKVEVRQEAFLEEVRHTWTRHI